VQRGDGNLAIRLRVAQDLGQFTHQHTAIARVLAGDSDPWDRFGHPHRGSAAAIDVYAADQRVVNKVRASALP
jgi:hypothetical protein